MLSRAVFTEVALLSISNIKEKGVRSLVLTLINSADWVRFSALEDMTPVLKIIR